MRRHSPVRNGLCAVPDTPTEVGRPILTARALRLGYDGRAVLDNVHLDVRAGEFWFLIGPNGQGKTTLLKAMMGSLPPLAGRIQRHGDFARYQHIGFVPQQCALNPTLPTTVREFVQLGTVGIRATKGARRERLGWALEKAGLGGLQAADYWSLSGGQRQRALIARALVRRPQLLVADEPTSGLDLSVEASVLQSLKTLNRTEHLTVIMVMHDLAVAARYGTHFALVHDGVVQAGTAQEILTPENLKSAYGVAVTIRREPSGLVSVRLDTQENADASP